MSECVHRYKIDLYSSPSIHPDIYCKDCGIGFDLGTEKGRSDLIKALNAYDLIKDDNPFDMVVLKGRLSHLQTVAIHNNQGNSIVPTDVLMKEV